MAVWRYAPIDLLHRSITAVYLTILNRHHAKRRVLAGRPGVVVDASLESPEESARIRREAMQVVGTGEVLNSQAFDDLTDIQNIDFIYAL